MMISDSEFGYVTFFCAYLCVALLNYFNVVKLATWTRVPPLPPLSPSSTSEDTDTASLAVPPLPDEEVAVSSGIQRLSTPTNLSSKEVPPRKLCSRISRIVPSRRTRVPPLPPLSPSSTSEDTDTASLAVPPLPDEEVAVSSGIQRLSTPTSESACLPHCPPQLTFEELHSSSSCGIASCFYAAVVDPKCPTCLPCLPGR
ncbi:hypothetical protein ECG_06105 [Echinococcus granulosus]|nr:hypothetical protein ECG_06105 [Echinococcus granulosus]